MGRKIWHNAKKMGKAVVLMAFVLAMAFAPAFGQRTQLSTQGTEFWVAFLAHPNVDSEDTLVDLSLYLISKKQPLITVVVENPGTGWWQSYYVNNETPTKVYIPPSEALIRKSSLYAQNKGLRVYAMDSLDTFMVSSLNYGHMSSDASMVLSSDVLDCDYYVQAFPPTGYKGKSYKSAIAIVATEDGTSVEIKSPVNLKADTVMARDTAFSVSLNKGQVVYLRSEHLKNNGDISGTFIKSNCKKIAVFAGNERVVVPDTMAYDHVYEQLYPINLYGKKYVATNTSYNRGRYSKCDYIRITSLRDSTIIMRDGVVLDTLVHAGDTYQDTLYPISDILSNAALYQSSKPVMACQYTVGSSMNGGRGGDPAMFLLSPVEQMAEDLRSVRPSNDSLLQRANGQLVYGDFINHYVNIVANTADRANVKINGRQVSTMWLYVTADSSLSYLCSPLPQGTGLDSITGARCNAYVYGNGGAVMYANAIGIATPPIDMLVDSVSIRDSNVQHYFNAGCPIEFAAVVGYEYDYVEWDFGDGTDSVLGDVVHHAFFRSDTFAVADSFVVTMIVHSSTRCVKFTDTLHFVSAIIGINTDTIYPVICAGATYDASGYRGLKPVSGHDYAPYYLENVYTQYLHDSVTGCRKNLVIDLTVNDTLRDTIYHTMCAGDRFDTNGHLGFLPVSGQNYGPYFNTGVYTQYLRDTANGCFLNLVIDLLVNDTLRDTLHPRLCRGMTFDTMGHTFDSTGVYTILDTIGVCLHHLVVDLIVYDTFRDTIYPEICLGSAFEIGGTRHDRPGVYTHLLRTVHGCDSVVVVNLTVSDTIRDTLNRRICKGFSFDTNNYSYTQSGQYVQRYREPATGCWTTLVLNLEVLDTHYVSLDTTLCAGAAFSYHDSTYFLQGVYNQIVLHSSYCELATIDVFVLDTLRDTVYRTVCAGASFDTNGASYYHQGVYTQHLRESDSCFHNLVIFLSVNDTLRDTVFRTVCAGAGFDTNGVRYYHQGVYTQHLRESDSCFHNLVIYLSVNDTLRDTVYRTVCAGAGFDTNGTLYYHQGVYTQHLHEPDSCYHNLVIYLSVSDTLRDTVYRTVCAGAPFDTNGRKYYLPGWYTQHLRESDSCSHNLVIHLSVNDTLRDTVYRTVCAGAGFDTNGIKYYHRGVYVQHLRESDSCYHNLVIYLSVNDTLRDTVYRTVCAGAPFDTNGRKYYLPGWYTQHLKNADSCCHNLVINLSVNDTLRDTVYRTVCAGASFDTNGRKYYLPGWYTQRLRTAEKCFRNLVIRLSVNDTLRDTVWDTVCAGAVFDTNGHLGYVPVSGRNYPPYYRQGVYTQYLRDTATGCYHNLVIDLAVNDTLRDTVYRTVCAGASFDTNGRQYYLPGWHTQHLRNADSCCHNLVVHLSVNDTLRDTVYRSICAGSSFDTNGVSYYHAGWHTQYLRYQDTRCYHNLVINISVKDTFRDTLYPVICSGGRYINGTSMFDRKGVYTIRYTSVLGCDSTAVIMLDVLDTVRDTVYRTICSGGSFDTLGRNYSVPDVYNLMVPDSSVCGAHKLTLFIFMNDTIRDTVHRRICAGSSFDTNGHSYYFSGEYKQYFRDTIGGCNHNLVIYLDVSDTIRDTVYRTVCAGGSFDTNGSSYYLPGWYTQHGRYPDGCFHNLVVNLTVRDTIRDTVYRTICAGGSFDTNGRKYYHRGWYTQCNRYPDGCFHNLVINISLNDTLRDTIYRNICAGGSFDTNGRQYTHSGWYTQRLRNRDSCCLNLVINVSVNDTLRDTIHRTLCAGGSFDTNGFRYYMPGVYTQYLRDIYAGCYQNLVIFIDVNDTLRDTVYRAVCAGAFFDTNGYSYNFPGWYTQGVRDTGGCYHKLTVHLSVADTLCDTFYRTICAGATFDTLGHRYSFPGRYVQLVRDVPSGCYRKLVFDIIVADTIRDTIAPSICKGQVFDTNGRTYTRTGFYSQLLRDSTTNCFNRLYIDLAVNDTFRDHIFDTVCAGASHTHNDTSYYLSGVHLQHYTTVHGCDSIVEIHLEVRDTIRDTIRQMLCAGATLDTNGVSYSLQGVYVQYLRDSSSMCFHNLVIDLTVNDTIRTHVYDTICEGEIYRFNGQLLTATGDYRHKMRAGETCDSITYLHLFVDSMPRVHIYDTVYNGGTYRYLDTTYTHTGIYYHLFQRPGRLCDSVVILDLWFCDSIVTRLYDTICNDSTYMFGGQLLTSTGEYRLNLRSCHGCDSIVVLNLTVVDYPTLKLVDSVGFCKNGIATLSLITNANDITWTASPYDSTLAGQEHNRTIYVSPKRSTEYSVVVDILYREKTCVSTASVVLNKVSKLKAIMKREDVEGGVNILKAQFSDISIGNVVYREWLFHESSPLSLDKRYEYDSIVYFEPLPESENYKVRLVVKNDEGCTDTTANTYPVIWADIWVPNAFTPDQDLNTKFQVGAYNISEYEIYIYNRAGLLVFKSSSLDDSWDGTYNGELCPPASYVYIINYKTKAYPTMPQKKVGSVLLIR